MAIQITSGQIKAANIITSLLADDAVSAAKLAAGAVDSTALGADSVVSAKIANGAIDTTAYLADSVVTAAKINLTGSFDFSSGTLRSGTPSASSDVANKNYVDGLVGAGVFWKEPVSVASVANINLSNPGTDTFDGVQITSGSRILIRSQSTSSQNGLYTFNGSGSALSRTSDADSAAELNGMAVFVKAGNTLADQAFVQTNEVANLGSDNVTFVQFSGLGQITAGDGLQKAANTLSLDIKANSGLKITSGELDSDLGNGLEISGSSMTIALDASTLTVGAGGLKVSDAGITATQLAADSVGASQLANDAVDTAAILNNAVTSAKIGAQQVATSNIANLAVGASQVAAAAIDETKLASSVSGNGLTGGAGSALAVQANGSTLTVDGSGCKVSTAGITATELNSSVAGNGLSGGGGSALSVALGDGLNLSGNDVQINRGQGLVFNSGAVKVDLAPAGAIAFSSDQLAVQVDGSTVEISSNALRLKDLGVAEAKLANSAVSNAKIAVNTIALDRIAFRPYQEYQSITNGTTSTIDLARALDANWTGAVSVVKNGLEILNMTALGGSASDNDGYTISVSGGSGGVARLTFGGNLDNGDQVVIKYLA